MKQIPICVPMTLPLKLNIILRLLALERLAASLNFFKTKLVRQVDIAFTAKKTRKLLLLIYFYKTNSNYIYLFFIKISVCFSIASKM